MKQSAALKTMKNYFETHGLKESTTPRQLKNGTLMYMDIMIPNKNITMYSFHTSGYFRRRIFTKTYLGTTKYINYQLNRTFKRILGNTHIYTKRILVKNIATQMELALNAIMKYRKDNS